jgi:hypothetical protein
VELFTPFQQIVMEHASRYPGWLAPDLYKLIHQAALGSGHAVNEHEEARARLEQELAGLGDGPDELLLDPIAPSGVMLRVHLRPLVHQGLPPDALLEAFLNTANQFKGEQHLLKAYIVQAIELTDHDLIHIRLHDFTRYLKLVSSAGYPAVHHSEEFTLAYRPAYRVVAREHLPREWLRKDGSVPRRHPGGDTIIQAEPAKS